MHDSRWVSAAPFRAHLNHVCASTGIPWPVLALHAGLPVGLVHHLLDTRPGRRVHRIAPELARRVLTVNVGTVEALRTTRVSARPARHAARRLLQRSWPAATLAGRLHVSLGELDALVTGMSPHVPALLDLRVRALLAVAEPPDRTPRALPAA